METAASAASALTAAAAMAPSELAGASAGMGAQTASGPADAAAQGARASKPPARLRPRGGFGGYLHELRRERGLTARALASLAGVHHTYVSKLERGDRQAPDEPVVEALAAALGVSPAQLDQLRWRAGLTPRGAGAPGQDDPTLTLVAEALSNPALTDPARDQLRRAIAQAVQGPVSAPWITQAGFGAPGGYAPHGTPGGWPGSAGWPGAAGPAGVGAVGSAGSVGPAGAALPPMGMAIPGPVPPSLPTLSPEAPPDPRSQVLAGLLGGWQTVDEAAAELRVTSAYLFSLVQSGQLRAWALPGGVPGSLVGLRLRRDDVLALLQPVRL